ncbi:MAG: DUF559 domain-containing protein, partial [Phycisphaerales bacterium]|nr:DUF559 domain-containing protein [Phycisphaerales bacterium]
MSDKQDDEVQLPNGWSWVSINETGEYINGFAFKPSHRELTGLPIVRIQNLTDETKPLNTTTLDVHLDYKIDNGDMLVSWSATLDVFMWRRGPALVNQHIFKVIPQERVILKDLLFYWLKRAIQELQETEHLHGSTMMHINRGPFIAHLVPLPPLAEQTRIVAKLEELLSDLDAGVAELKAAQKKLTQYRQSLLKAAVEGALTAEWRATHVAPLPPRGGGVGGEGALPTNPHHAQKGIMLARARDLRRNQTPDEQRLWQQLRAHRLDGFKFCRQQQIGHYIVDFVCFEKRLIIELDGGGHSQQTDYDAKRDAWLSSQGFRVMRFWNNEWAKESESVLNAIWLALNEEASPLPNPSPTGGEGLENETGAELLKRILIERRARWEAKQLAKFKEQGKPPPKDWQKKYPEPVQPDTTDLPELPEGWVWA